MTVGPRMLVAVAIGGAAGALLRHALTTWVPDGGGFAWTTLAINLTGSAALAALAGVRLLRRSDPLAAALGPGVLGGFTTMSAASEQTRSLLDSGDAALGAAYLIGSVLACVAGVALVRHFVPVVDELVET